MRNTFLPEHLKECSPKYHKVKEEGPVLQVIMVIIYLLRDGKLVTPHNLRPAGKAGDKHVNAFFSSQRYEVILVEERWAGPHKAHLTLEYIKQLRDLVKARLAQEVPNRCKMLLRTAHKVCGHLRSIQIHGPELVHLEDQVINAYPVRDVQGRPSGGEPDRHVD